MQQKIDELNEEIEKKRMELEELKSQFLMQKRIKIVRPLEDYTVEEKVKFFDDLYARAIEELDHVEEHSEQMKDGNYYMWKRVMSILEYDGKSQEFWDYYNNFLY